MNMLTLLQRQLSGWDRSPWKALIGRIFVTLICFQVWTFRFVKSPFRMEEVDPAVLEAAKGMGLDLLDPKAWPTWQGMLLRHLGFLLLLAMVWWLLSRLRIWVSNRWGAGVLAACLLLIGFIVIGNLGTEWVLSRGGTHLGEPVWGGWVRMGTGINSNVPPPWPWFMVTIATLEPCFLLFHSRLALLEARQDALRARLSPHFLFNALNTLHAQIEEDPASAQETTERLAGLFRQVLEVTEHPTIPLKEELAFVEDYLGIERSRMGSRLCVSTDIDEGTLDCQIPVLGLQVLVENAIKHGLEPRVEGGEIRISTRFEKGRLHVAVQDPGNGQSRSSNGSGKALANLRARLNRPSDLVLSTLPQGFEASFTFPQVRG